MVSYKKLYLEAKERIRKLEANRIDLSIERKAWMRKNNHPYIFYKNKFRIEEQDDMYLLYVI